MSSPAPAQPPDTPAVRQPDAMLYDFEAVLRLVDHAIAELSEHELSPLYDSMINNEVSPDGGDGETS